MQETATLSYHLKEAHRLCDKCLADAEEAASADQWRSAQDALDAFTLAIERHIRHEEELLFPPLEMQNGAASGPTRVMRHEHVEIYQLIAQMRQAAALKDRETYLALSETLGIMMQEHNTKEEHVLYPMLDELFGEIPSSLRTELDGLLEVE